MRSYGLIGCEVHNLSEADGGEFYIDTPRPRLRLKSRLLSTEQFLEQSY